MPILIHSEFTLGDTLVRYQAPADAPDRVGVLLVPVGKRDAILTPASTSTPPASPHSARAGSPSGHGKWIRSAWSAEGRHIEQTLEDLQLERSWSGYGIACE